ncbi:MAG: GDSL-type esterase/lipase family protein [Magnetospirillum sp.]|nr:GDSL-type esterase/lipase family protein [Magnetospirillum sp.]
MYKAVPRTEPHSRIAHEELLAKARAGGIDLYFLGDSITRRWGATDYPDLLAHWRKHFYGWNAGNFGWGGDTTWNILWRVQNGELDGVNPKVIVLLAGTNNIGKEPIADPVAKVAEVTQGVQAILELCREKAPKAKIVVMGIFPRNDGSAMPVINQANENLAKFADGETVRYLNINDRLADRDGQLFDGIAVDKLHLRLKGYQVWADALKPVLTELLGPRAKTRTPLRRRPEIQKRECRTNRLRGRCRGGGFLRSRAALRVCSWFHSCMQPDKRAGEVNASTGGLDADRVGV